MSSYMTQALNKKSGEVANFACIDDYFGRHEYGYILQGSYPDTKLMTQAQFSAE